MPILKKKSIKSIIEYFSSIICTSANRNGWNLCVKDGWKREASRSIAKLAVKGHFQLKFCA